jgi:hypothetical protein
VRVFVKRSAALRDRSVEDLLLILKLVAKDSNALFLTLGPLIFRENVTSKTHIKFNLLRKIDE